MTLAARVWMFLDTGSGKTGLLNWGDFCCLSIDGRSWKDIYIRAFSPFMASFYANEEQI